METVNHIMALWVVFRRISRSSARRRGCHSSREVDDARWSNHYLSDKGSHHLKRLVSRPGDFDMGPVLEDVARAGHTAGTIGRKCSTTELCVVPYVRHRKMLLNGTLIGGGSRPTSSGSIVRYAAAPAMVAWTIGPKLLTGRWT